MLTSPFSSRVASAISSKMRQLLELRDRLRKRLLVNFLKTHTPLREFAESGYYVFRSFLDESEISRLKSRYLNQSYITHKSQDGNVAMPFFDVAFIRRFYESDTWKLLSKYGKAVYGSELMLQSYPLLVLTKPTFSQEEFSGKKHKVPALFHTDYPTE